MEENIGTKVRDFDITEGLCIFFFFFTQPPSPPTQPTPLTTVSLFSIFESVTLSAVSSFCSLDSPYK